MSTASQKLFAVNCGQQHRIFICLVHVCTKLGTSLDRVSPAMEGGKYPLARFSRIVILISAMASRYQRPAMAESNQPRGGQMTCMHNTEVSFPLHARYAALKQHERNVGKRFDMLDEKWAALVRKGVPHEEAAKLVPGFIEARDLWDRLYEDRSDMEEEILAAPITSDDDLRAKLEILAEMADTFDNGGDVIRQIAAQHAAWRAGR